MKDRVLVSTSTTNRMVLSLKYWAYLPSLSFSCYSAVFLLVDQATKLLLTGLLCPGGMELAENEDFSVFCETSSDGQSAGVNSSTASSG